MRMKDIKIDHVHGPSICGMWVRMRSGTSAGKRVLLLSNIKHAIFNGEVVPWPKTGSLPVASNEFMGYGRRRRSYWALRFVQPQEVCTEEKWVELAAARREKLREKARKAVALDDEFDGAIDYVDEVVDPSLRKSVNVQMKKSSINISMRLEVFKALVQQLSGD